LLVEAKQELSAIRWAMEADPDSPGSETAARELDWLCTRIVDLECDSQREVADELSQFLADRRHRTAPAGSQEKPSYGTPASEAAASPEDQVAA
jgi:hypothetical protein